MIVKALKTFDYSHDGIRAETLRAGSIVEIKNDLVPGLIAAGCIGPIVAQPVDEPQREDPAVEPGALSIKHTGRGRYAIYRGDERLTTDALDRVGAESALAAMRDAPISENAEG